MSLIKALFINMGKVVPYFKMTPELANQLHSNLGKLMLYVKSSGTKLTKKQQDYIMDQTKQLDLYEKSMTPPTPKGPKAEVIDLSKKLPEDAPYSEKNPTGWMPTEKEREGIMASLDINENLVSDTINLLKGKTDPKDMQSELKKIIGRKGTYADYSDDEIKAILNGIEDETKSGIKSLKTAEEIIDEGDFDPSGMKDGGRIGYSTGAGVKAYRGIKALMDKVNKRFGKGTIKTAEEIDRPEKAKLKEMFDAFNERLKKKTRPSRKEYERLKDEEPEIMAEYDEMWSDEGPVQMSMEDLVEFRTLKPAGQGRFTKAEAIRARLENTIKEAKPEDEDYDWVMETFPKWIDEIEKNPSLADNETVWKELGMTGMPSNQRFKIYDDGTVDFETKKFRLKEEIKRKLNASGGLNYLMGL